MKAIHTVLPLNGKGGVSDVVQGNDNFLEIAPLGLLNENPNVSLGRQSRVTPKTPTVPSP